MGPIFNESLLKKEVCGSHKQYGNPLETHHSHRMRILKKKKKTQTQDAAFSSVPKQVLNCTLSRI